MKYFAMAAVLGLAALPSVSRATIFVVNVFSFDFSMNLPGGPVVDPIINVGDTVRWNWINPHHSSTSDSGQLESWDSGVMHSAGATFDHTFTNVGVFTYHCVPHQGIMSGTVTVVPEPGTLLALSTGAALLMRRRYSKK